MDVHRPMRQHMILLQEHLEAIRFFLSGLFAQQGGFILNPSFAMGFASCSEAKASRCFFCDIPIPLQSVVRTQPCCKLLEICSQRPLLSTSLALASYPCPSILRSMSSHCCQCRTFFDAAAAPLLPLSLCSVFPDGL